SAKRGRRRDRYPKPPAPHAMTAIDAGTAMVGLYKGRSAELFGCQGKAVRPRSRDCIPWARSSLSKARLAPLKIHRHPPPMNTIVRMAGGPGTSAAPRAFGGTVPAPCLPFELETT